MFSTTILPQCSYLYRIVRWVLLCIIVIGFLIFTSGPAIANENAADTGIQTDSAGELSPSENKDVSSGLLLTSNGSSNTFSTDATSISVATVATIDPSSGLTYSIKTGDQGYGAYVTGFSSSTLRVPASLGSVPVVSIDFEGDTPTSLDVSGCTSLRSLYCESNHAVDHVRIADGNLTTLNASGCTSLGSINCAYNRLRSIDLTGCISLGLLFCNDNRLTSLDISAGYKTMTALYCSRNYLRDTSQLRSEMSYLSHQWLIEYQYASDISQATISAIDAQHYTGSAITPAITVTLNTVNLTEGTDYKLTYTNNVSSGMATITVAGLDVYEGSQTVVFQILPALPATGDMSVTLLIFAGIVAFCGIIVLVWGHCLVQRRKNN